MIRLLVAVLAALASGACRSAYEVPIPEPLPEVLAWHVDDAPPVAFGAEGEENDSGSLDALFFAGKSIS